MSELLPYQKNSTLLSRVLSWMLKAEPMDTSLPVVIMQECFTIYIRRQVRWCKLGIAVCLFLVLRHAYSCYLMKVVCVVGGLHWQIDFVKTNEWVETDAWTCSVACRLLVRFRYVFLYFFKTFGYRVVSGILLKSLKFSGDLLQHFLTVIFDRLGKGELSDDDFELNIILQVTRFGALLCRDTAPIFIVITSKKFLLVNGLHVYPCSNVVCLFIQPPINSKL